MLQQGKHGWYTSLAVQFVLLTGLLTSLTVAWIAWSTIQSARDKAFERLHEKGQILAQFVASISGDRIFSLDMASLFVYAKLLNKESDVVYAAIFAEDGTPLTTYLDRHHPSIEAVLRETGARDMNRVYLSFTQDPNYLSILVPIIFSGKTYGDVRVVVSKERVIAETARLTRVVALVGVVVIVLLCFGLYAIFRFQAISPIYQLNMAARRVAQGNLHEPVNSTSRNELGQLAESFNSMMRSLFTADAEKKAAMDQLNELNRTLERRVEERTQAIEQASRELERMALYDGLTNLPNRILMKERLERVLAAALLRGEHFIVALLDIDRFKEVNETLGHHAGDELLAVISERVKRGLRMADLVARFGSDEFAVIFPDTSMDGAQAALHKLLQVLDEPVSIDGVNIKITATIGAAVYPEHGSDAVTLLKRADIALYEAKATKLDFCFYSAAIDSYSPRRLSLMADLQRAMSGGELTLHYQTIHDLRDGTARGVEALARWPHPEQGFISPVEFIPLIEQTGFVKQFAYWTIDTALAQWSQWRDNGIQCTVSVNLAMRNLQDRDLPEQINELLRKWSATPHSLMIEITESGVMHNSVLVSDLLHRFKALHIDVAIDDFGTGYSSLNYLKRLPVQEVKIDRAFVKDMVKNKEDAAIVKSVIDLAHNLGLKVVAEGVENGETLEALRVLGCDFVQGYFLSKPVAGDTVRWS